mmetsp:Transcript_8671/g.9938  ORF Transcript_8671/g.9938 Transcript_8671/m.9938 type:complete len:459 (-) Transcript_8671:148-1524(-)
MMFLCYKSGSSSIIMASVLLSVAKAMTLLLCFTFNNVQSFSSINQHGVVFLKTITTTQYLSKQQQHFNNNNNDKKRSLAVLKLSANNDDNNGSSSSIGVDTTDFKWKFQGHEVYTKISKPSSGNNNKPIIVLIHGFGCSTTYWRRTISSLIKDEYEVHAIDLLGQGQSSKPNRINDNIEYSIHLWSKQVDTYIQEYLLVDNNNNTNRGIILGGNSLGSLVALSTATADYLTFEEGGNPQLLQEQQHWGRQGMCRGIVMFNCGIGLNSLGIANEDQWDPVQSTLIRNLYNVLVVLIFKNYWLLEYALSEKITPDLLKQTLSNLYTVNPQHVDDELAQSFYQPTQVPSVSATVEVLSQIYCNDPGRTPMDLHRLYPTIIGSTCITEEPNNDDTIPIHLIWGDKDLVTPLEGSVGQLYTDMAAANDNNNKVTMDIIQGGHIPFDDNPKESNKSLLRWLNTL